MKRKVLLLLIAGISVLGIMAKTEKDGTPIAKFGEMSHNFGTIKEAAGPVTHTFEFMNTGNANLVIIDARAECGCTRPDYPKNPIAPGKKGKIKVTYNPAGRPGSFDKVVTIRTNGQPKKIRLKVKGSVIPK